LFPGGGGLQYFGTTSLGLNYIDVPKNTYVYPKVTDYEENGE
jgi:hypothetical protein